MKYNLVKASDSDDANLTVFVDGEMYVATNTHPNFDRIVAGVVAGDESVVELFDVSRVAAQRFERLSERVSVANGRVLFDGDEVDNSLTKQVVRFVDEGVEDFKPLVAFFEKVMTNPNEHSREQLFRWLQRHDFTIAEDGNFLAYKGVRTNATDEGVKYVSIHSGHAMVDGESFNGNIPNHIGAVVEMPRSVVQHDPSVGCHTGLHAGTWDYAHMFAQGAVLKVTINPRDVVSVPTDCEDQKLRVCRYEVLEVIDAPETSAVWYADSDVEDEQCEFCYELDCDGECQDYCNECGEYDCEGDCQDEDETEVSVNNGPYVNLDTYVQQVNANYAADKGWDVPDTWSAYDSEAPWNR